MKRIKNSCADFFFCKNSYLVESRIEIRHVVVKTSCPHRIQMKCSEAGPIFIEFRWDALK
jgi:hypothetical protein